MPTAITNTIQVGCQMPQIKPIERKINAELSITVPHTRPPIFSFKGLLLSSSKSPPVHIHTIIPPKNTSQVGCQRFNANPKHRYIIAQSTIVADDIAAPIAVLLL